MNEDFINAVATANELRVAAEAAQKAINEAVIATLLQNFPPLAAAMSNNLASIAEHNRPNTGTDSTLTIQAFDGQIAQIQQLIAAFQR